jgi:hypothetical protein
MEIGRGLQKIATFMLLNPKCLWNRDFIRSNQKDGWTLTDNFLEKLKKVETIWSQLDWGSKDLLDFLFQINFRFARNWFLLNSGLCCICIALAKTSEKLNLKRTICNSGSDLIHIECPLSQEDFDDSFLERFWKFAIGLVRENYTLVVESWLKLLPDSNLKK